MTNHDDVEPGDDGTGGGDPIDRLGRTAGAELRRAPSTESFARVTAAGRRRRTARTAVAGAAAVAVCAAVAVGVIALRDPGDSRVTENPPQTDTRPATTAVPTTVASTTSAPTSAIAAAATTEPETATPDLAGPIEIGPAAEFAWGDGVVLGAYVDDGPFVAYDAGLFVAPELPEPDADWSTAPSPPPTELLDRTGTPAEYVMYDEGCGAIIASPAFTPFPDAAAGGWMTTAGHPFATLDGAEVEDDPAALDAAIDAALRGAGLTDDEIVELARPLLIDGTTADGISMLERLTPTVSLDDDVSLETLVFRYDPELVAANAVEMLVWFAVWDPDTAQLVTVAGDPAGDGTPFAVNGEGPLDVDGDGRLDTTIRSGTSVRLVRLIDGETIATAERCPVTLEVSVAFDGFGDQPIDYTVTAASSAQSFSGQAAGEQGQAGPFTFDLPLGVTGTYVVVHTPAGPVELEALLGAGRNVIRMQVTPEQAGGT